MKKNKQRIGQDTQAQLTKSQRIKLVLGYSILGSLFLSVLMVTFWSSPTASSLPALFQELESSGNMSLIGFRAPYCYPCYESKKGIHPAEIDSLMGLYSYYDINALDLQGEGNQLAQHFGIMELPAWILIDEEGNVTQRWGVEDQTRLVASAQSNQVQRRDDLKAIAHTYSISWKKDLGYWQAIEYAELLEPATLEPVWIQQQSPEKWEVLSGRYESEKDAETAQTFITIWNSESTQITTLKPGGWALPQ